MKKRGRLRKGLAMLLSLAMVVGLMPGAGTIKVSAEEGEASGSVATAEGYDANGFCESGSFELTNGTWALKNDATACATHGETCNGYQPANKTTGTYEVDGDSNTQDEVYEITNAGQLYWFADKINNDYENYKDKNAVLTTNITVNESVLLNGALNTANESTFRSWTPIGYYDSDTRTEYSYSGIFDGQGYTISGLYFNDDNKMEVGLFGESKGTIKKVSVTNSYFYGQRLVGCVCGYNTGTIEDSNNIDSFVKSSNQNAGGVCGWNGGTITDCNNTGKVQGLSDRQGNSYVGGICGSNDGSVKNCINRGKVTATGGIVGGVCGNFYSGSLESSYNTGEVQGSSYVGGVCGEQYEGSVDSCYNTGDVTSTGDYVGGVCGLQDGSTSNCYSTGSVTSEKTGAMVGGVCGMQYGAIKNCYYDTGKFTGKAIHTSTSSSQTVYVEGKTSGLFSNGGVAYLLNSRSAEDSPVWYQNIDNGAITDTAPVLDSSHGTVYASKPCPVKCSNTESTASAESQAHSFGDDNICTVCGAKGEIIDDPTLINDKPSNVDGVYQIKTVRELYYFVALVNGRLVGVDQDTSASAVLTQDIVVNDNLLEKLNEDGTVKDDNTVDSWVTIGYDDGLKTCEYTGTFDGKGHIISGLYLDSENYYIGLFGISSGTIKNVAVKNCYFKGKNNVGAVCGYNKGLIENCTAENGSVCAFENLGTVGGICGSNDSSITNCSTQVTVVCSEINITSGGICGSNNAAGTVSKCHSSGNIQNTKSAVRYGGVCGINYGNISDCYNETAIKNVGTGTTFGGICGQNHGEIITSYNTGEISFKDDSGSSDNVQYGGICGRNYKTISDCYNSGSITYISSYGGGICGYNYKNDAQIKNCYDGWNNDTYAYRIAAKNNGTIINCYYLYTKSDTSAKTSAQFASGEVAYLLNEGKSDNDVVWRQTISTDTAPVLDSTHSIVYASKPCESEFANTEEEKKHTVTMSEDGTSHTCSVCKKTEQHADVATFTVNDENHSITAICPSDCDLGTITLSASDETYDGADKAASISGEIKGFDTPSIVYKKKAENGSFETIDSTPKGAGTYRASITYTVDEAKNKLYSVSVTYDISPATPTLTWPSEKTVGYTGNAITEDAIGEPTVTLVNEESYNGTIQYSYRTSGSSDEFTSGLPTEIGTYEVKAVVDADGNYAKAEKSMTLTIAWLTDVADATLTDQSGNPLTGESWWAQSVTFTPPEGYTICGTVDGTYDDFYTYSTETAEAGTDVTYYLKNKTTGELAQKSAAVRVDTTAPDWSGANGGISIKTNKWKSLLSTISFGLFYKETVDVTVSASDSLSGVAKYYYYVDTSAGETVKPKEELDALANGESGFTECDVTYANAIQRITSLSADSSCVVYVYAVDAVGNKSDYICSNGVVIDKTSPIISNISTPSKGSGEDATLTDTKADMTFTASESGTYFYIVKKSSEDAPAAINDFADSSVDATTGMTVWKANESVTADAMTADNSNKLSLTGLTANTAYTVYVIGVDRAGNASDVLSKEFTTCKTMPEVTTNPTLSGTYGTAVSAMTLENGVAKAGDTVIDGTWTLTDGNASDVPSVGATKSYEVTFTPADTYNGQYDTVSVSVIPTVNAKKVTVTAENKSKTYGQDNPALTFTVPEGSLVGSDTVEALGVTLSCEATKTSPVKEGGYAITGTSSSANYDVTVTPGTLTINQASAEITVGEASYSKTFGDAAFDLGVTDSNTDEGADVTYAVSDSKNAADTSVDNDKVITVDASGKVTIVGAGSATITASLAASNNFTAATSKTITVTVAKKTGYTVSDIQESYLYSKDTDESIDLSKYIPADCGTVAYGTQQTTGDLYADGKAPAITDGKLTYTVKQAEAFGATGTITVTVSSDHYADFVITVSLKLIDKIPVKLQSGSSVSLVSNTLTYGEVLSTLTFNKAVFVDGNGTEVAGTLDWADKTMKPAVAVTSAAWKFTPENSDYATVEGNLTIKVEKAEPDVTGVPTVADRIYHPNAKLADTDLILTEASVLDVNGQKLSGTWTWKTADVIPTVNNSGYDAVFTPADTDNYNTITKTITVNVTKATPYIKEAPTVAAITYGGTLADATLTGGSVQYSSEDTTAVAGTFAWKVDTTKPAVTDSNTTAYTVVFTPTNKNYNTVEKEITVTVSKANAAPNKPDITMNVDYGKEKVSDITTLPEGWAWQDADKDTALTVGTAVKATAVYTGADKGNYVTESVEISITRLECTHATTEVKNAKDATCTEKGYTGDTYCKVCGEKVETGQDIDALGHSFAAEFTVDVAPTCATAGSKSRHCTRCDEVTDVTPIDKLTTHSYVNGVCSVCDDIFKTTVDGVTYQVMTETGADGKPVGKLVTVSGNEIMQVAVAVTGTDDNFTVSDGKVTVPSEITGSGSEQTFVVTKIAEDAFSGVSVTEIVIPATVTEVGTGAFGTASTITFKGNTAPSGIAEAITETVTTVNVPEGAADSYRNALGENANIVEVHTHTFDTKWTYDETYHWHVATCGHAEKVSDKAVHTFGEWTVTKKATEDAEGVKERSCSCSYKETAKIDKLAHTIHVKDKGTRVEPTCEKKGSITYKCTKCGEVMEVVELDATGHKWDAGKVTKEATETAEGVKTYTCSVCGKTKTEAIPKKEATTQEPPKKGDVVKDDKTSVKVEVTDVKKKEVEYKEPANKKAKTVSIPATVMINGVTYKVTKIADNAFKNNKTVTKVTVGSNIKTIGKNAFYKCTKLKTVKIGKNVTTIGSNAFKGCSSLTSVTLPSKATKIGANAFNGCKKLKTIKITSTKLSSKTVAKNAFKGLTKATTIKVPKKKLSAYKKLFKQKGLSSKVKVIGY